MSVHEFLALVVKRFLVFRQFRDLERSDKQEGMVPDGFWESWERRGRAESSTEDLVKASKEEEARREDLRYTNYVSCWNASEGENALMWLSYAPRGVAVRTTVGRLKKADFENGDQSGKVIVEYVEYADDWRDLENRGFDHEGIVQNRLFFNTKRKLFSAENEVRIRIQPIASYRDDHDPHALPHKNPKCWPAWFPVVFANLAWIDEVVADSALAPWSIATLSHLIELHGIRFRQSGR